MSIRGVWRLQGAARRARRWLRHPFVTPALILMYHRVAELPSDPQLLCVTPRHFAEHLEVLRKQARPVQLGHLVDDLRAGHLPARAVAVTLDDGYADNLFQARPLLERHEVPGTVFVTAGRLASPREFWWDELDRLILQPGTLPANLRLTCGGRVNEWDLAEAAIYDEAAFERHRDWHIERPTDPTPRQHVYHSLYEQLHSLPEEEQQSVLEELRAWAGAPAAGRPSHRMLTADEVIRLGAGGLIEIGAHTMSHPVLAALPASAQRCEIRQSKARLEDIMGQPVAGFAYPHGSGTRDTAALVRGAGFGYAGSSLADNVWPNSDPFWLPRLVVRDWDGDAFGRFLNYWLRG